MAQTKSNKLALAAVLALSWIVLAVVSPVFGQPHARIAVLTPGMTFSPVHEGLKEGLARIGYKEGQNITFVMEDTKGSSVNIAPCVAKLLAAKPDVLFSVTTMHTIAAKQATSTVPIVFAWSSDPDKAGLIAGYASSKNNLTGVTSLSASLSGKRLEVFLELAPKVRRLLILEASMPSAGQVELPFLEQTAKKLGVKLVRRVVANRGEIEKALRALPKGSVDAVYFLPSAVVRTNIDLLINKAKSVKIPLAVSEDSLVKEGALFSYGPNTRQVGIQAAPFVDRVLKGTKPSDIVVETPDKLFVAVNLTTAKEIGLTIPRSILERADRLIE